MKTVLSAVVFARNVCEGAPNLLGRGAQTPRRPRATRSGRSRASRRSRGARRAPRRRLRRPLREALRELLVAARAADDDGELVRVCGRPRRRLRAAPPAATQPQTSAVMRRRHIACEISMLAIEPRAYRRESSRVALKAAPCSLTAHDPVFMPARAACAGTTRRSDSPTSRRKLTGMSHRSLVTGRELSVFLYVRSSTARRPRPKCSTCRPSRRRCV